MTDERMPEQQWHLDKRVPVAIIFAILMQSLGGVWWAASINERTAQIERRLGAFAERSQQADREMAITQQTVAVLSAQLENQIRSIERLEGQISETNSLLREYFEELRSQPGSR